MRFYPSPSSLIPVASFADSWTVILRAQLVTRHRQLLMPFGETAREPNRAGTGGRVS